MNWLHRTIAAGALLAGVLSPMAGYGQAPPPVPALPDTERRTSYSIVGTNCACSVGFALYGDSTDYQDWVEVFLNGTRVNFNDGSFGWTITSPTGPLATIPRPITDAVLTFNTVQSGTIQIVGARRPRRTTQFQENRGVAARDLNQALTDIIAQNRETWDKTNDVTGRALLSQPGNTVGLLPLPATCINGFLGFDASGLKPVCQTLPLPVVPPGNLLVPGTTVSGDIVTWGNALGTRLLDQGNGVFNVRLSYGAVPDGSTNNATAIANAFAASNSFSTGVPTVYFDCNNKTTTCVYNYGGSGTSPINPTIATSIVCEPGVILNYTGTAHAADIGPTGAGTSKSGFPYTIKDCRWEGGATQTAGIFVNNLVTNILITGNVFHNFGSATPSNTSGASVVLAGNNFDPIITNNIWHDNDGVPRNVLDAHGGNSSELIFSNNAFDCQNGAPGNACQTSPAGYGVWTGFGRIVNNLLAFHYPNVRMANNGTELYVAYNHFEGNTSPSPLITYGDPGGVAQPVGTLEALSNFFFQIGANSGIPIVGPETPATGSYQLSPSYWTSNLFASAPGAGAKYVNTNGAGGIGNYLNHLNGQIAQMSGSLLSDIGGSANYGVPQMNQQQASTIPLFDSTGTILGTAGFPSIEGTWICADTSGSGTAQSCQTNPEFVGGSTITPVAGDFLIYKTTTTNTGDLTINVNGLGAAHVRRDNAGATLNPGDIAAGVYYLLIYDGTFWQIHLPTQTSVTYGGLTFANLPAAVTGKTAYITDGLAANCADTTCTTWGTNVTGGTGALKLLIWYNGTHWTLAGK